MAPEGWPLHVASTTSGSLTTSGRSVKGSALGVVDTVQPPVGVTLVLEMVTTYEVVCEVVTAHVATRVGVEESATLDTMTLVFKVKAGTQVTSESGKGFPFCVRFSAHDESVTLCEAVADSANVG